MTPLRGEARVIARTPELEADVPPTFQLPPGQAQGWTEPFRDLMAEIYVHLRDGRRATTTRPSPTRNVPAASPRPCSRVPWSGAGRPLSCPEQGARAAEVDWPLGRVLAVDGYEPLVEIDCWVEMRGKQEHDVAELDGGTRSHFADEVFVARP